MQTAKTKVAFILVRPQFLGNIGSVARVMKNFGFSDLRFVEPPRNYKDAEARKMAVAAFDVLKNSTVYSSLTDAAHDLNFVVGTSSGQQRKEPLEDLAVAIKSIPFNLHNGNLHADKPHTENAHDDKVSGEAKIGVAFGDEVDGLRRDELSQCHLLARVPTNPQFPSLNLSQAAGIIAYELSTFLQSEAPIRRTESDSVPPTVGEVDELFEQLAVLLEKTEFARPKNKAQVLLELRQFFYRTGATKRENDLLRGIMHKLNQAIHK